ncbi:MAG TPA: hypothetical protein VL854_05500 [Nitrososphaeraceae archaeon]|jgi:hypothetical protein|nr:hypothetical protein [Nitrososphaeraceae archaeon]
MKNNKNLLISGTFGLALLFVLLQSNPFYSTAQAPVNQDASNNTKTTDPSVMYTETARNLLNQVSTEYKKGNFSGAEELATRAYLDNFEYVEAPLEKKGAGDIMKQLEDMMRKDLRSMIKDEVPFEKLNSHINATNAKLAEAIIILNGSK